MNADLRVVYVVGEPGIGKSTAMAELTSPYKRAYELDHLRQPRREWVVEQHGPSQGRLRAVELGARSGKHPEGYPGTDAMSMSAIVGVEEWLVSGQAARETHLLLGEGARLGVRRFVDACRRSDAKLSVVHVCGQEVAAERRAARGSQQAEGWIKGARTRASRLADYADSVGVHVLVVSPVLLLSTLRRMTEL